MLELDERLNAVVRDFVYHFNEMCRLRRKDLLVRQKTVQYESGSRLQTYQVSYRVKVTKKDWQIYAVSNGFWIFKSKFPLFRIIKLDHKLSFAGLYTEDLASIPISANQLKEQLDRYLHKCEKLPQDAFTKL